MEYPPRYERIRSIKIIKKNENVASLAEKAKIIIFFRSVDFADWFGGLKNDILNSRKNRSEKKLVRENAVEVARSGKWGSQ